MLISYNRLLAAVAPSDMAEISRYGLEVRIGVGKVLHEEGEPIEFVYFPQSGLISLQIKLSDKMREVGFVGREGVAGSNCDPLTRIAFTQSVVAVGGVAYRVPFEHFAWTMQRSPTMQSLVGLNNVAISERGQQIAACNLTHHLDARLCRWILQLLRHGTDDHVIFVTQEKLSQLLGVDRARLNEAMKALSQAGVIEHRQRGAFEVMDVGAIEARACPCSRSQNFLFDRHS